MDHLLRDHGPDPAQQDQAMAMLAGAVPAGQAGPFPWAEARSRTLALPTGARPAEEQGESQSAAQSGADGSAAACSTGSTGASASGSGTAVLAAMSVVSRPAPVPSRGDWRGQGSSHRPPAPGVVVPLRPMTRIQQGTLIRRRSREGAPPPTPGRRCPGTSRA